MKSYAERIEAVSEARMQAEYAETEKLIEIFFDGDTVYAICGACEGSGWESFEDTVWCSLCGINDAPTGMVPLQPKGADDA